MLIASPLALVAASAITRDGARDDARRELSRSVYDQAQPSLVERAVQWMADHIRDLLDRASSATPGGVFGLALIVILLAIAVVVAVRLGPLQRARTAAAGLDAPAGVTAADLRQAAESAARDGRWADAVRARLRAVVRTLEDRTIIEPRPGRTATEVAVDAGQMAPPLQPALNAAARTFNELWYGGRSGTAEDYLVVAELDDALARYRPRPGVPVTTSGPAVPA